MDSAVDRRAEAATPLAAGAVSPDRKDTRSLHGSAYVDRYRKKTPERIERILRHVTLAQDMQVVDVGCGNAMLLPLIARRVRSYVGVDFSEDFIALAEEKRRKHGIANASFFCGAIQDFCRSRPETIDVVFALDLSEHVYDDEWQAIVDALWHCLKPGGTVYLHTPNRRFLIEMLKERNVVLKQFPEHVAVRDAEANEAFFRRAGFREVSVKRIPHYNVLRCLHWASWLPFVGRYFAARLLLVATK